MQDDLLNALDNDMPVLLNALRIMDRRFCSRQQTVNNLKQAKQAKQAKD